MRILYVCPVLGIATGAFVTCTDQLHMLHNYVEFSEANPSHVQLALASVNSDACTQGYGYLHAREHNVQGFCAVSTFYHPNLWTTIVL